MSSRCHSVNVWERRSTNIYYFKTWLNVLSFDIPIGVFQTLNTPRLGMTNRPATDVFPNKHRSECWALHHCHQDCSLLAWPFPCRERSSSAGRTDLWPLTGWTTYRWWTLGTRRPCNSFKSCLRLQTTPKGAKSGVCGPYSMDDKSTNRVICDCILL